MRPWTCSVSLVERLAFLVPLARLRNSPPIKSELDHFALGPIWFRRDLADDTAWYVRPIFIDKDSCRRPSIIINFFNPPTTCPEWYRSGRIRLDLAHIADYLAVGIKNRLGPFDMLLAFLPAARLLPAHRKKSGNIRRAGTAWRARARRAPRACRCAPGSARCCGGGSRWRGRTSCP